ncbi:MAG TPA: cobalamin-binding protein, partial [Burkholderiales bacterium]
MEPSAKLVDAAGERHAPARGDSRIVSLVPSITELVCDLGLAA